MLAHSFSALAVELEAVRSLWDINSSHAKKMLVSALKTTNDGLNEAKRSIRAMRSTALEDIGLALAVRKLAEETTHRGGVALQIQVSGDYDDMRASVEQTIYRIATEALSNVFQHAHADNVVVILKQQANEIYFEVRDEGCGFNGNREMSSVGMGLQGMHTRATEVGGKLTVQASPQRGQLFN